ncbi:MAG: hypothetical protein R3B47_14875 [Bacteroidia bacterium]
MVTGCGYIVMIVEPVLDIAKPVKYLIRIQENNLGPVTQPASIVSLKPRFPIFLAARAKGLSACSSGSNIALTLG